jgi:hypothetical protein
MKYLKTFERIEEVDLVANPKWDDYTTDLFNQYCKIYTEDGSMLFPKEVIDIFNEAQDEIEESDSIDIYKIEHVGSKKGGRYYDDHNIFYGLAKAYGPIHACIKLAIAHGDCDILLLINDAYIIEDDEIESKIKALEEEIKEWKTIY